MNAPHLNWCYLHECPGMFKCYQSYCIPYRYICDRKQDCPSGEDEENCTFLSCPGMLKCKEERICVRRDEECDGFVHCIISLDDETHCDLPPCPQNCQCFGFALMCKLLTTKNIPSYHHETRALQIQHSTLIIDQTMLLSFLNLIKLQLSHVHLNLLLDSCFIRQNHLVFLDISYNEIAQIISNTFIGLSNLLDLEINDNAITSVNRFGMYGLTALFTLNLSRQFINQMEAFSFYEMDSITVLDLSENMLISFQEKVFFGLSNLAELNIKGNPIFWMNPNIFIDISTLVSLITSNAGVCCFVSEQSVCSTSSQVEYALCNGLLAQRNKQIAIFSSFALLLSLNGIAFFSHLVPIIQKRKVTNNAPILLHSSDLFMSLYFFIIIGVNAYYDKSFLINKQTWLDGWICKAATFPFQFSVESSLMARMVIPIGQLISVRYPFHCEEILKKWSFFFNFYWLICIGTTSLRIVFMKPISILCLRFINSRSSIASYGVMGTEYALFSLALIIMIVNSSLIVYSIWHSCKQSGRKWHIQDTKITIRLVVVCLTTFFTWMMNTAYIIINNLDHPNAAGFTWNILYIFAILASFNPIAYTITSKESRSQLKTFYCAQASSSQSP